MLTYRDIVEALSRESLELAGGFHPTAADKAPEGCKTLLLIAPSEPGFWPHFKSSPEYSDGAPDPLDRWSLARIGKIADELGARPIFPFGGPPWHPFISWAKISGRVHKSPVSLLVHDRQGLMISFRGALAFDHRIELAEPPAPPCASCSAQPCRTACPVNALSETGYDTAACHAFLDRPEGADCLTNGCKARRACPVSIVFDRNKEQSAFHMRSFHPNELTRRT